jgi:hypothetical protein
MSKNCCDAQAHNNRSQHENNCARFLVILFQNPQNSQKRRPTACCDLPSRQRLSFEVIEAHPAAVSIEPYIMPNWWMCTLCAIHPLADRTADADGVMPAPLCRFNIISIDKIARVMDFASKGNGKFWRVLAGRRPVLRYCSGNGEKPLAIRQLG